MITLDEFRTGKHGIPLDFSDELPECCSRCAYLVCEEFTVCFVEDPFYYYCAYNWPGTLTTDAPPCLEKAAKPRD